MSRRVYWHTCRVCWVSYWECPEGKALHEVQQGHRPQRHVLRRRHHLPLSARRAVLARDGFTCQECGFSDPGWEPIHGRKRYEGNYLTLDHIVPWTLGGTNEQSNLRTLCFDCNQVKSSEDKRRIKRVLDYLRERGEGPPGPPVNPRAPDPIEGVAP